MPLWSVCVIRTAALFFPPLLWDIQLNFFFSLSKGRLFEKIKKRTTAKG
jgi:hypothetical protein